MKCAWHTLVLTLILLLPVWGQGQELSSSDGAIATPSTAPAAPTEPEATTDGPKTLPLQTARKTADSETHPGEIRITGIGNNSALNIALLLTFLTLIPSILLCVTPFARLLVVFHFLRQALGLQTTPSNQTLIGLALILTFFLVQPMGVTIYRNAIEPYQAGRMTGPRAFDRATQPVHDFMLRFAREKDLALFVDLTKEGRPHDPKDISMRVLVPAYIISELRAGFEIGAILFLPFMIIDMVVAAITTSIGMFQLPPVVISTPIKLLLFVMVDGWNLVIGSLMKGLM